jgi:hypothetical protein
MNRQLFEYHPVIGYKFIPNLKTRIQHESGGYLVTTNNLGFRSDIDFFNKKLPNGKKRILIFGDSFTAGDGVSNKFRYTDLLKNFREDLEIYNFGLSGSGTDQQYLIFDQFARNIEFDLIIISVLVENIRRVNSHFRFYYDGQGNKVVYQKPYFELINEKLELKNVPVRKEMFQFEDLNFEEKAKVDTGGRMLKLRELIKQIGLQEVVQKVIKYQPLPEYNHKKSEKWILMQTILGKWISEINSPKVVIMPLPLYQYTEKTSDPRKYQARFNEFSEKFNVKVLDPLPSFLKYSASERRGFRFLKDVHLTKSGHEAIAKFLLNEIQNQII